MVSISLFGRTFLPLLVLVIAPTFTPPLKPLPEHIFLLTNIGVYDFGASLEFLLRSFNYAFYQNLRLRIKFI